MVAEVVHSLLLLQPQPDVEVGVWVDLKRGIALIRL